MDKAVKNEEFEYSDVMQSAEALDVKTGVKTSASLRDEGINNDIDTGGQLARIKTEHKTEKWNESVLPMANIVVKADPDASALHTEFDIKIESSPSTSTVPTTR
nr:unnamed protein product [Callosobruchus chinensis]